MGLWQWLLGRKEPTADERIDAAIREKEKQIAELEKKVAALQERRSNMSDDAKSAQHEAAKWEEICKAAAVTNKESDVRDAVRQRLEAEQKRDRMNESLVSLSKTVDALREQLALAQDKIDYIKSNHATLSARLEAAKIREELAGDDGNGKGPLTALSELEDRAVEAEAKAQAYEETSRFQEEFLKKNVVHPDDIDAEVAKLMQKHKQGIGGQG